MSQSTTPSEQVSNQTSLPAQPEVGSKKSARRKPNRARENARSLFNPAAPPISAEKWFSDFVEKKRNNVDVVFDTTVQSRLAAPYVTKARDHAVAKNRQHEDSYDLQALTYSLVSLTIARKMLLSTPQSEEYELGIFKDICKTELMAPKALIAAVANIGKFELDDKTVRLKYGSQDVFRMLMTMCKVADRHSDYHGMFQSPIFENNHVLSWDEVDVSKIVIPSESSVRWMRDEASRFLDLAYETDWEVVYQPPGHPAPPPVVMRASYPRLQVVPDPDRQLTNVISWLAKLNRAMPDVDRVIAAGFATAWRLMYFQRPSATLRSMHPNIPDWIDLRPINIIQKLGLHLCSLREDRDAHLGYVGFVREIHHRILLSTATFAEFLDLAKQPDEKFGTAAQLLPYTRDQFVERVIVGMEDFTYPEVRLDAETLAPFKIKDKGQVVAGLAFGFSKAVQVTDNFIGRLNGSPLSVKNTYLRADFKNY